MRTAFKRVSITGPVAGFALALAAAVSAQTPVDPHHPAGAQPPAATPTQGQAQPQMPGGMMDPAMMSRMMGGMGQMMANCPMMVGGASHAEGRIAFLKAELAITDAQKAVWEPYAAQIAKNLQGMQDMQKSMMAMMEGRTPLEHIDARVAAMEKRAAALKEIKPTLAALYSALNADQKKKADQILTGMGCMM
jgi:hypothetical protein